MLKRAIAILLTVLMIVPNICTQKVIAGIVGEAYYVSAADGDDLTGDGSLENPWKTIQKAANHLLPGDVCYIREGVYRETITPASSGTEQGTIRYQNYNGETVVVSGLDEVSGWQQDIGDIYWTEVELELGVGNQVFVAGEMMMEARWPNNVGTLMNQTYATMSNGSPTTIVSGDIPTDIDLVDAYIWFRGGSGWAGHDSMITGRNGNTLTIQPVNTTGTHYDPRSGNRFYIWGKKELLDTEKEWWYDDTENKLYLWAPEGGVPEQVQVKRRQLSFDLSDRAYIELIGINTMGATINTDANSNHLLFKNMKIEYPCHMARNNDGRPADIYRGIQLKGYNNEINSCEFGYSSSGLIFVGGQNHTIINSFLHDGNYAGTWGGLVTVGGEGHYIGYNTMTRAGRDVIGMGGASRMIIEHNDLSQGAMVCNDTAMIYTPNTDGMGTEIRYNKIHDINPDSHLGIGIYLDNSSSNYLIHHNVIWNIPNADAIRLNTPSNYNLVYNNTIADNAGRFSTSGSVFVRDLYGNRIFNNIIYHSINYPNSDGYAQGNNLFILGGQDPKFVDPSQFDFRIQEDSPAVDGGMVISGITDGYSGSAPDIGAYELGQEDFVTGHNFSESPTPNRGFSHTPYQNLVKNGGFETKTLDHWETIHGTVQIQEGNAWQTEAANIRMQKSAVKLSGNTPELEQTIEGLQPNTRYTFSAWGKASDEGAVAVCGVRDYGGDTVVKEIQQLGWTQITFDFVTGPTNTAATVFLTKGGEASSATGNLFIQDSQSITASMGSVEYDVTSFIQRELEGDQIASLIIKGTSGNRITFYTKETTAADKRPVLRVSCDDGTEMLLPVMEDTGIKYRDTAGYDDNKKGAMSTMNVSYWSSTNFESMYVKFDLTPLEGKRVVAAYAQLHTQAISSATAVVATDIYGLGDDSWSESTAEHGLDWENRPTEIIPIESLVYFDDIGMILPLDEIRIEDEIKDMILTAQKMLVRSEEEEIMSQSILDGFRQSIQNTQEELKTASTYNDLDQIRTFLHIQMEIFEARVRIQEVIQVAQRIWNDAEEGEYTGQYFPGSKELLLTGMAQATDILNAVDADKEEIESEQDSLQQEIDIFHKKVVLNDITELEKADMAAMLADPESWSAGYANDAGYALFTGVVSKYQQVFGDQVFTMGINYDYLGDGDWPGMVLRSQHPTLPVLGSGDTSYFIIFKKNTWELQKRINGTQVSLKSYPNTQLKSGITGKVDAGAVDVIGGVRVFCYVDGEQVFDIIDREDPIPPGYMGIVPQGNRTAGIRVMGMEVPEVSLQGPSIVNAKEKITLTARVSTVSQSVYGVDMALEYDPVYFSFHEASPLQEGMTITDLDQSISGILEMQLWADEPMTFQKGDKVVQIQLEAKEALAFTTIRLPQFLLIDGDENEIRTVTYGKTVMVEEGKEDDR